MMIIKIALLMRAIILCARAQRKRDVSTVRPHILSRNPQVLQAKKSVKARSANFTG